MAFLASDSLEGRETGTRGYEKAADYVAKQFEARGARPLNGSYFQQFSIRRAHIDEDATSLVVVRNGRRESLSYGRDFVTYGDAAQTSISVNGPLLFIGDGVTVAEKRIDAYSGSDATGKLVLVFPGAPRSLTTGERSYFEAGRTKRENAAAHGASALLFIDDPQIPWELRVRTARQLGASQSMPGDRPAGPPIVYINPAVVERLTGQRPDRMTAPSEVGSARLELRSEAKEVRSANVIAVLGGGSRPSEYLVVTAPLDHIGIGATIDGDNVYNGAVDNASGVSGLLTLVDAFARLSKKPARSIVFVTTTAEEQGEIDADYFVRHTPVPKEQILAAFNIDGLSFAAFKELEAAGGTNSSLGALAEEAARRYGLTIRNEPIGVSGSDHAPFLLAGIPVLWLQAALPDNWMSTRYHTPADDMNQPLDFEAAVRHTKLLFGTLYLAAEARNRPTWTTGDFFSRLHASP